MSVPSYLFVAVAILVALLVNASRAFRWREGVMLAANLAFLASFARSPWALVPFAGFLAFGYAAVALMQAGRRAWLGVLAAITLALFFWLKRYSFVPSALFLPGPYVTVGLSYVFFRVLSLVIDAGQGALTARVSPASYVNYTLNFPSLVAGPIQMYPDWLKHHESRPGLDTLAWSVRRIVTGLFKVMLLSTLLDAVQVDARANALSGGGVLAGAEVIALYPVYLYFNFSGYCDVVIGAARLMGLRLPENFDRPFSAPSFIEFWNRWHITLSTWLRTYVYSPLLLTLMRRLPQPGLTTALTVLCFFVTFFLVGAWHGQTGEFLFFGVLQGGGVAGNKLWQLTLAKRLGRKRYRALGDNPLYTAVARGLTFTWFAFTLLWFWSDWATLGQLAAALGTGGVLLALALIWAGATVVLDLLARAHAALAAWQPGGRAVWHVPELQAAALGAMVMLLLVNSVILSAPPPPIVYKAF